MPIKLVRTEFTDLPQIARVRNAAFGPSEHSQVLFPGGAAESVIEKRVERLQNEWKEDPTLVWWNAVDTESGEIVGAAKWHTYFTERPESEWMKDDVQEDWGQGANPAACTAFFGAVHESRRRLIGGKPHILLSVLVTLPEQQRRGAGSMLVKWGCDLADEKNLLTYLEATPTGYPVYKKQGFVDIDAFIFEYKQFTGRDGSMKFTNMMRPPKEA